MAGAVRLDGSKLEVGDRVVCDNHKAFIRFIGQVPPTKGLWLGVEWDDPSRGKHDGCHEGVRYFQTSHPRSGSFVRPTKVDGGITAVRAVNERYGLKNDAEAGVNKDELFVLDQYLNPIVVEMVGAKKVNMLQSQFNKMKKISMFDMRVYAAGPEGELGRLCPNVTDLDVSSCLLSSWERVSELTCQMPHLKDLNVSDNRLLIPKDPTSLSSSFAKVQNVTMNQMNLNWKEVLTICCMFPALEELHCSFNNLVYMADSPSVLAGLKVLDLMTSNIQDWNEVLNFGNLPRLQTLIINEDKIKSNFIPDCSPTEKTAYFPRLKSLIIKKNDISDFFADAEDVGKDVASVQSLIKKHKDISPSTPVLLHSTPHSDISTSLMPTSSTNQKLEPGKTGLLNFGNTCYINSAVQALYMCDQFRKAVLTKTPQEKENLMGQLQSVFAMLKESYRSWITPTTLLKACRPSWFLPDQQQDCSEFVKYLCNQLHEDEILSNTDMASPRNDIAFSSSEFRLNTNEFSKVERKKSTVLLTSLTLKMEEDKSSRDSSLDCGKSTEFVQSLVENYFAGKLKTTIKCLACGHKSVSVERFFDISLSIPNSSRLTPHLCKVVEAELAVPSEDDLSLNDLISFYLKSEKLTEDNKYQCQQCRTLQDAERSLHIIDCPEYLIMTLLRFSYDSTLQRMNKIFKDVYYPCTISIPVYKQAASTLSGHHVRNTHSSTNNTTGVGDSHLAKLDSIAKLIAPKCDSSNEEPQSFQLYGLTAVIVHSGPSSECGHYYCYARHAQDGQVDASLLDELKTKNHDNLDLLPDKWYRFNDKKVTSCTLNSFRNSIKTAKDTSYVLIYVKLHPASQKSGFGTDPALSPGLMDAVIKDNEAYLKEQEAQVTMFQGAGYWIDDKKDRARRKRTMPQEMDVHKRKKSSGTRKFGPAE